jgi:hypothetical protein
MLQNNHVPDDVSERRRPFCARGDATSMTASA